MTDKIISWYNGYKGEEYPLVFLYRGKEKKVKRLVESKYTEDAGTKKRKREFLVETEQGTRFDIIVGEKITVEKVLRI
jgi:hypothetical protein